MDIYFGEIISASYDLRSQLRLHLTFVFSVKSRSLPKQRIVPYNLVCTITLWQAHEESMIWENKYVYVQIP